MRVRPIVFAMLLNRPIFSSPSRSPGLQRMLRLCLWTVAHMRGCVTRSHRALDSSHLGLMASLPDHVHYSLR
ncbi:hypothetical protein F4820DRAFT_440670 [Hypoxylon rubiginosum]|uniref:Uncharacterized protein n=1 Tax=Hypoxylon rubiginosum TaxID=110542 RepID=A0ACB9YIA1_9PEZI|nr:hypothetical protein F4820DRAFT_440670 [Hypoxylon rubiginosum]